ncbi:hypothetical protein ASG25_01835 [Rhizobium sp. Leaf384]|uniref:hypothetical protein n=1 Tax=unclassified Rhizobium TaxID=2613769 RepID=UPI0007139692|nr:MULTISPECIES: hypothetical protein [unclassified Rhizobium]KQS74179.1 hypothetical protein ASG58_16900 [Rhizobium sp. Leaf383]KQS80374.1 hypothetical protein ASG25_01835 [Rhizobium sp. Leaf384]
MVNKKVTFADVEDPLFHAATRTTIAMEFVHKLLAENSGLGTLSQQRIAAAHYILETAETAALEARDVYFEAFAQNKDAAFGKTPAAASAVTVPSVSVEIGSDLEDLRQQLEICFMASAALPDEDDKTAMRTGLSRALDLLKVAERHLH